jgi:hypothetical protein
MSKPISPAVELDENYHNNHNKHSNLNSPKDEGAHRNLIKNGNNLHSANSPFALGMNF